MRCKAGQKRKRTRTERRSAASTCLVARPALLPFRSLFARSLHEHRPKIVASLLTKTRETRTRRCKSSSGTVICINRTIGNSFPSPLSRPQSPRLLSPRLLSPLSHHGGSRGTHRETQNYARNYALHLSKISILMQRKEHLRVVPFVLSHQLIPRNLLQDGLSIPVLHSVSPTSLSSRSLCFLSSAHT